MSHLYKNAILFGISFIIIFTAIGVVWVSSFKIPDFKDFGDRKIANSTKIYDRTGEVLLYNIHQDTKRTDITFEEMGQNIKNATVAIEDAQFYNHGGIKISSIIRATLSNIFGSGRTQGGSTITQQLVKNTLLTQRRTVARKVKEWVLAIKIDRILSKDEILKYYLNESPYGGNIYGVMEASRTYFNKNPKDLTLAEASYLASIPQSPTVLSPYGKNKNRLDDRKNLVLSRLLELDFINQEEYDQAKNEVVVFQPQTIGGIKASHFVFFIKDYLEQKYGADLVEKGGLNVITTLDYELQAKGEQIVQEEALKNAKDWNGENAALVAIDPKTGQIISMIGSRNYFDKDIDGNFNVATANRQPGSAFKPFIYATAFEKGFTPETVLFDLPTEFNASCDPYGNSKGGNQSNCYMPQDYDGNYLGPLSLRSALAQSRNIPAVKLFYLSGLRDSLKTAEDMGISTLVDISRYGLTLVIGGGEVSLLDMTSAYGVFANNGTRNPYTGILKVIDSNGNTLEEFNSKSKEVLSKNVSLTISDILSDNVSRAPTFGLNSMLNVPNTAVKTGTTNSNKDAWTVGYSPSIVVGVWAGNNDNTSMKKGGVAMAGPMWNKYIKEAMKKFPGENFEKPNLFYDTNVKPVLRGSWLGNDSFFVDKISGKLATINTPKETIEEKVITSVHTILYWVDPKDVLGPPPLEPQKNSQFYNWEVPIQNWWAKNSYRYNKTYLNEKPIELDDVHVDLLKPEILISEPNNQTIYKKDQNISLIFTSNSQSKIKKIDIFMNDDFIKSITSPFVYNFTPNQIDNIKDINSLTLVVYDEVYNSSEVTSFFNVE